MHIRGEQGSMTTARSFFQFVTVRFHAPVDRGQSFAEYAVILGLVVLVGAAGISNFGSALSSMATNTFGAVIAFL